MQIPLSADLPFSNHAAAAPRSRRYGTAQIPAASDGPPRPFGHRPLRPVASPQLNDRCRTGCRRLAVSRQMAAIVSSEGRQPTDSVEKLDVAAESIHCQV